MKIKQRDFESRTGYHVESWTEDLDRGIVYLSRLYYAG